MMNPLRRFLQLILIQLVCFLVISPAQATNSDLLNLGVQKLNQENYQTASSIFEDILTSNPHHLKAKQYLCFANLNLDNYQNAIANCSAVIEKNPKQIQAYLWRGLAYYRSDHYQEAIHNYNQILDLDPEHPQALYNRGLARSAIAQFSEALTDYNRALAQSQALSQQEKAMIYNDRGILYLEQKQYQKAREDFSQATHLDDNNSRSLYNLGCACHYLGEHQTAIRHFTHAIEKSPDHASAYITRGLAFYQLDYPENAIEDLKTGANLLKSQGKQQAEQEIRQLIRQLQPAMSVVNYA